MPVLLGSHLVASQGIFYRPIGEEPLYPDQPGRYGREVMARVQWHLNPAVFGRE
jgi:hypothetical protein